jgi:hypothetical protein
VPRPAYTNRAGHGLIFADADITSFAEPVVLSLRMHCIKVLVRGQQV